MTSNGSGNRPAHESCARIARIFGGHGGLRDLAALESAVARPGMTFDGEDLYPDLAAKVAALIHLTAEALAVWSRQRLEPREG